MECNESYDSDAMPFCPRCGSTRVRVETVLEGARATAEARDPRRRRAQMGGVILVTLAGLGLFFAVLAGIFAPQLMGDDVSDVMASLPGGELHVQVLRNGTPVEGAAVRLSGPNGSTIAEGTTEAGWFNATSSSEAVLFVNVLVPEGEWSRQAVVLQQETLVVRIDVATDPTSDTMWLGLDALLRAMRIVLVVFGVAALVMLAAGVSALRLRNRALALTGALVGLLPMLVISVAAPNWGAAMILALIGAAVAFIWTGRDRFTS